MKLSQIFIAVFAFSIVFSTVSVAKTHNPFNMNNPSVQLLKKLNDAGKEKIQNEISPTQPDIQADTSRVQMLKKKFYYEKQISFPNIKIKE